MRTHTCLLFVLLATLISCSILDKKTRQYHRALKRQHIPSSILHTTWRLESITGDSSPCFVTFSFEENGLLVMHFKDRTFEGSYLIGETDQFRHVFVGTIAKIAWTEDPECATNPSIIAMYLNRDNLPFEIDNDKLTIISQKMQFTLRKL